MGAIGLWLDTACTPEMEDRLLTTALVPWTLHDTGPTGRPEGCLGGVAFGNAERQEGGGWLWPVPAFRFNALCMRLGGYDGAQVRHMLDGRYPGRDMVRGREGGARAAVLIRNRILRNRARRVLQGTAALVGAK